MLKAKVCVLMESVEIAIPWCWAQTCLSLLLPVPGHRTQPICPNGLRHAVSPNTAQPTTAATACPGTPHIAQPPPLPPATESPHQHPQPATLTMPARPSQHRASAASPPHPHPYHTAPMQQLAHNANGTTPAPHPLIQWYNHQLHPAHTALHLHHPHAGSKSLAMVEYGWEWEVGQVGELLLEPLLLLPLLPLLPCAPLPCKEQG
jgi:hypothetical protein